MALLLVGVALGGVLLDSHQMTDPVECFASGETWHRIFGSRNLCPSFLLWEVPWYCMRFFVGERWEFLISGRVKCSQVYPSGIFGYIIFVGRFRSESDRGGGVHSNFTSQSIRENSSTIEVLDLEPSTKNAQNGWSGGQTCSMYSYLVDY